MLLISNLKSDDKRLSVVITKVYLLRWRIEEYFKFKKQQFDFENFRVRSLNLIRALNTLVTLLIGLISIMSEHRDKSILVNEVIECSKRIYDRPKFIYYALGDGIFSILQKTKTGITKFLAPAKYIRLQQKTLFGPSGFNDFSILSY